MSLESCKTRSSQQRCILLTQPTLIRILQRPTKRTVINTRFDKNYAKSSLWFWILTKPTHNIEVNTILLALSSRAFHPTDLCIFGAAFCTPEWFIGKACLHPLVLGWRTLSLSWLWTTRPSTMNTSTSTSYYLPVKQPGRVLWVRVQKLQSATSWTTR